MSPVARLGKVADAVLPRYGLRAIERTLLQYENNAVYRIVTRSGEQFVVRVATTWGRSAEEQRSEMQWLEALQRETSLVVPEPVRNLDGELVTLVGLEGSTEVHVCVVLRWVRGTPAEPGLTLTLAERIGAFTAEMHRFAERFAPERGFVRPRWDWERLFGARSILHYEKFVAKLSSQQRDAVHAAGEQIGRALSSTGRQTLREGLIHGDLHSDNILTCESGVGVIDFDDCGFGCYLLDIASVLDSFERRVFVDRAEYREAKKALLGGYTQVRPLMPDSDEYLGIFMAMRSMVTLDYIVRSKNANVQEWGWPRVGELIEQMQGHVDGYLRPVREKPWMK